MPNIDKSNNDPGDTKLIKDEIKDLELRNKILRDTIYSLTQTTDATNKK